MKSKNQIVPPFAFQSKFLTPDEIAGILESPETFRKYFPDLQTAAERGDTGVQMLLGTLFSSGIMEPNLEEARKWFTLAAQHGVKEAVDILRHLGQFIRLAKIEYEVDGLSLKEMLKKAKTGDAHAQYLLAGAYQNGIRCKPNMESAFHWYKKAADQQYGPAFLALAEGIESDCFNSDAPEIEALFYYNEAAKLDDAEASMNVGRLLIEMDSPDNREGGAKILQTLAEKGNSDAALLFGVYCEEYGTKENVEKAIELLKKLIPDYDLPGRETLAECLLRRGTKSDQLEAFELLKELFEKKETLGAYYLGKIYEEGGPTEPDFQKAFKCYFASAKSGCIEGMESYSRCLSEGIGCKKDTKKAKKWLEKARQARRELQGASGEYVDGVDEDYLEYLVTMEQLFREQTKELSPEEKQHLKAVEKFNTEREAGQMFFPGFEFDE